MNEFEIYLAENENDYIEFEKGTYEAFSKRNPNNWLCRNYKLIDNCRYQSTISYKNQFIFLAKEHEKTIGGLSLNKNMKIRLQSEDIGFEIQERYKTEIFCEALVLFILRNTKIHPFEIGLEIKRIMFTELMKINIFHIIGTCSENLKMFYEKFGFVVIDEKINFEGDKKFLLKMDIQ